MKKELLLFLFVLLNITFVFSQRTVSGKLTAENGEPLIGAIVSIENTNNSTSTDSVGTYKITIPDDVEVLTVAYLSFQWELKIGTSDTVDAELYIGVDVQNSVVTALGIEKNQRDLPYTAQSIPVGDILSSGENNLVNALNSKVAGVMTRSSAGSPGASSNIRIRGSNSITGNTSPLFILDGIPVSNEEIGNLVDGVDQSNRAIDINPNDIETISVLKGPAAMALYGVRGANGAIMINTKRGVSGKPKINYSVTYGSDEVNKLPARQNEFAQGRPADTFGTGVPNTRIYRGPETAEGFSWGPAIADLHYDRNEPNNYDKNGAIVGLGEGTGDPVNVYDPYDFFQRGNSINAHLSILGGSDKLNYYFSGAYLNANGVVPKADFSRLTFRGNLEAKLSEKLKAGVTANLIRSGGNRIQRGANLNGVMLSLLRTTPTFDNSNGLGDDAVNDESAYIVEADGSQRSYRAGVYDNPYWTINKNFYEDDVNRVIAGAYLVYDLNSWASLSYKFGTDYYTDNRINGFDINPSPFNFNWSEGSFQNRQLQSTLLNSDLSLSIERSLNEDLSLSALVGHNYYSYSLVDTITSGFDLGTPGIFSASNVAELTTDKSETNRAVAGVFGTVDLNYKNLWLLNLSGRNDWSSALPKGNNSFFSYGAGLSFVFSELPGLADNSFLSYGRVFLNYGRVGNDAPVYATDNYFESAAAGGDGFITPINFPVFGLEGLEREPTLANDLFRPESSSAFEVGTELDIYPGRLSLGVTYFNTKAADLLIGVQIARSSGFLNTLRNAAEIRTKGWEVTASFTPVRSHTFSWNVDVNFTNYDNIVESLDDNITETGLQGFVSTSSHVIEGHAYGALYGSGFLRDENNNVVIGDNGWPLQDPDQNVYGNPNPDYTAGVRNTFTFFNSLKLSALLDIRQGGDMWCGTCGVMDYFGVSKQTGDLRDETVVWEGVTQNGAPNTTAVPYADVAGGVGGSYWVRYGFGGITEMNIFDTSWLRLRELTLSYNLPERIAGKLKMSNASLAFTGRNLWLSTKYPGIDPETNLTGTSNGFGLDYFNMPNTKGYSLTLRGSF